MNLIFHLLFIPLSFSFPFNFHSIPFILIKQSHASKITFKNRILIKCKYKSRNALLNERIKMLSSDPWKRRLKISLHKNGEHHKTLLDTRNYQLNFKFHLQNPAMDKPSILDSVPPATITSASPNWIILVASPMEWAPVAQAVTAAWFGPCKRV